MTLEEKMQELGYTLLRENKNQYVNLNNKYGWDLEIQVEGNIVKRAYVPTEYGAIEEELELDDLIGAFKQVKKDKKEIEDFLKGNKQ